MKKIFAIITACVVLSLLIITPYAAVKEAISYNAGVGAYYDNSNYVLNANLLYTNVEGLVISGQNTYLGSLGDVTIQKNTYNTFNFPTFVGYETDQGFYPFATTSIQTNITVDPTTPANNPTTTQTMSPLFLNNTETGAAAVMYSFGDYQSLVFVGSFGGFSDDVINSLSVRTNPQSQESGWLNGTYYVIDRTANVENGKQIYYEVPWNRMMKTDYEDRTGQWSLDPITQDIGVSAPLEDIDWIFVGSFSVQAAGGVSLICEYNDNTGVYTNQYHYEVADRYTSFMGARRLETLGQYFDLNQRFFLRVLENAGGSASPSPDAVLKVKLNGTYNTLGYSKVEVDVPQQFSDTMIGWLLDITSSMLNFKIAPNFTIGGILTLIVGLALIIWLLKVFLGG